MDPGAVYMPERVEDLGMQDVTTSGKGVGSGGSYQTAFSGASALRLIVDCAVLQQLEHPDPYGPG
jgi:hypothetical protein